MGGVATYINQVIEHQQKQHEVFIVLSKNNSDKNIHINENHIRYYNYSRNPKFFIPAIREINKYIKEINPDIIHIHSTFAGFFARLFLFRTNKHTKIIYCSHGWSFLMDISNLKKKIYSAIEKVLSRNTDSIINISNYEYNESVKFGIPSEKSTVIYNGVRQAKIEKPVNLNLDKEKINLLFVGRFDRQKGLDILLDTFKTNQFANLHLYLIGEKVLSNDTIDHSINNVTNIGWVDNKNIDAYYSQFDAVIIPSRWEGFGLVAAEAMRNKKAIIASNKGALPELVTDGLNGFVFDLDNTKHLISVLNNLDKKKLETMGENGFRIFQERFSSDVMNQKIIEEYKKVLS